VSDIISSGKATAQPRAVVQGGGKPRPIGVKLRIVECIEKQTKKDRCEKIPIKQLFFLILTGVQS